jgi:hypothetical protein
VSRRAKFASRWGWMGVLACVAMFATSCADERRGGGGDPNEGMFVGTLEYFPGGGADPITIPEPVTAILVADVVGYRLVIGDGGCGNDWSVSPDPFEGELYLYGDDQSCPWSDVTDIVSPMPAILSVDRTMLTFSWTRTNPLDGVRSFRFEGTRR